MVNAAPVTMDTIGAQNEIRALSRAMNAAPVSEIWFPRDTNTYTAPDRPIPTSVLVTWGQAKLIEIRGSDLA
jgi:hypothetical protein